MIRSNIFLRGIGSNNDRLVRRGPTRAVSIITTAFILGNLSVNFGIYKHFGNTGQYSNDFHNPKIYCI